MSPNDKERAQRLKQLIRACQDDMPIPGLLESSYVDALVGQFIDSIRRIEFAHYIRDGKHSPARMDPASSIFDPLRAAVLRHRQGATDEAWWLVFLGTHFGKHGVDGWRLARDIYGRLGQGGLWDWATISAEPSSFHDWLQANEVTLRGGDGISRRFSNHRKYESLRAGSKSGTSRIVMSYVEWVSPPRTHSDIIREIHRAVGQDPKSVFAKLYDLLDAVPRFGRLGRFDFLTMLGKLGIAPIAPGSTFLKGATGPLKGARLLFGGSRNAALSIAQLEGLLSIFGERTGLSPQVLEDAVCNWQKSPDAYVHFKG